MRWANSRRTSPRTYRLTDGLWVILVLLLGLGGCGSPVELPADPPPPAPPPPTLPPPAPVPVVAPPALVGVPTNLTISADNASVDLYSWDLVNSAQAYRVEWLSDEAPLPLVTANTATHGNLTNNLRHLYTVTIGTEEAVVSFVPVPANATAPPSVSVTPGLRDNSLAWSPVNGASGYRVYWSYEPNITPATGRSIAIDGTQTSYTHSNLDAGTHYYYVVTAVLSNGTQGTASAEVGARPGQTIVVTATISGNQVDLDWSGSAAATVAVATSQTFDVPFFPSFPLKVAGLENDRRYAFRVRPVFDGGPGPASTTVYATPKASINGVPASVRVTAGRGVHLLVWDPAGASSYDVSWTAVDDEGRLIGSGTETVGEARFRHSGLEMCQQIDSSCPTYSYFVRVSGGGLVAAPVEARAIDLRGLPPLVTNSDLLILTGTKPSGSRVEIDGAIAVPFDRDTGWTATVPIGPGDGTFDYRLTAVDEAGRVSVQAIYVVTLDTTPPSPLPTVTVEACDPPTASPRQVTLSGTKDVGSAVFRLREPAAADQQIVGTTSRADWLGILSVQDQTIPIELIARDAAGNSSPQTVLVDLASCP